MAPAGLRPGAQPGSPRVCSVASFPPSPSTPELPPIPRTMTSKQTGPFILYSGGVKITTKTLQKSLRELMPPTSPTLSAAEMPRRGGRGEKEGVLAVLGPPRTSGETEVTVGGRLAGPGQLRSDGGSGAGSSTSTCVVQPQDGCPLSSARVSPPPCPSLSDKQVWRRTAALGNKLPTFPTKRSTTAPLSEPQTRTPSGPLWKKRCGTKAHGSLTPTLLPAPPHPKLPKRRQENGSLPPFSQTALPRPPAPIPQSCFWKESHELRGWSKQGLGLLEATAPHLGLLG